MKPSTRAALAWAKTIHTYLGLLALLALLFFTVTGWLMVHQEALGLERVSERTETLAWPVGVSAEDLEGWLLDGKHLRGRLSERAPESLQFRRPGGATLVEWDAENRVLRLTHESHGFSGRLFDLHRNRGMPGRGTWMQDVSAGLLLFVSLSGLLIWLPLPKRRVWGAMALCLGLLGLVWWTLAA